MAKTYLNRKILEAKSISEIRKMYSKHNITLPNHQYICMDSGIHSLEIRPSRGSVCKCAEERLLPADAPYLYTNHFRTRWATKENWIWTGDRQHAESKGRLNGVRAFFPIGSQPRQREVLNSLEAFANRSKGSMASTCATVCFQIDARGGRCMARYHFSKFGQDIGESRVTRT